MQADGIRDLNTICIFLFSVSLEELILTCSSLGIILDTTTSLGCLGSYFLYLILPPPQILTPES